MAQQNPSTEPVPSKPHDEDEIVHTPTPHRARWIMGILLLILILTTFTVGDEITKLMTGQSRSSAYATWNRPGVGEQSISGEDWQGCMRSLSKLYSVLGKPLQEDDLKEVVAQTLLVSAMAQDAGIAVTDKELGDFIVRSFGSGQNYQLILPRYRVTPKEFESILRQVLIVERYTTLLADAWNTPDIAAVEKSWKAQHQEYAFDYVMLPVANALEEAKKAPITDEELHAYFDALSQPRKDSFRTREKLAAELIGLAFENAADEALFAKYPKPADEAELEKLAKDYFDAYGMRRFPGKTYDESKDAARTEALAYASMQAWLKDLRERQDKGQAIDLVAESAALGLALVPVPTPLEQSEWLSQKPAPWIGTQTPALVFGNATDVLAGKLYPAVIVDDGGFVVVEPTTKVDPAMPAFEEISDKLREEMWQKRARDFASVHLELLRDKFGTRPPTEEGKPAPAFMPETDEETFYKVAKEMGFEPQLRDYEERSTPFKPDAPPIDMYAKTQPLLYTSPPNTVLPANTSFDGKNAFLVRVRGVRDPDPARMTAGEFANVSGGLKASATTELRTKEFSFAALQSRYGLNIREQNGE
ncbi:MAG: SurA N-terminal domain-containing protein [Planctomycetes bacterium]|nr:SurA N-terminal domain-containing protein [Planctomycetota bacterium]